MTFQTTVTEIKTKNTPKKGIWKKNRKRHEEENIMGGGGKHILSEKTEDMT